MIKWFVFLVNSLERVRLVGLDVRGLGRRLCRCGIGDLKSAGVVFCRRFVAM